MSKCFQFPLIDESIKMNQNRRTIEVQLLDGGIRYTSM